MALKASVRSKINQKTETYKMYLTIICLWQNLKYKLLPLVDDGTAGLWEHSFYCIVLFVNCGTAGAYISAV